jgi:hypothetical protein
MAGRVARWLTAALGTAPLFLLAATADALTRDDEALGFERTPPRLSYVDGEVKFFRAGSEDWTAAQVNTPLAPGDLLLAGDGGNLELQIGTRAFVRGAEQSEIGLTTIEPDFLQLRVTSGTVALDLRALTPGQTLEVDTPNAAFKIEHAGYYRLEVADDVTAFTTRRGGLASATVATGETVAVRANEQLAIQGTLTPQLQTAAAPELDAWDRWNYERSEPPSKAVSAQYVPSDVYGTEDLDRYGDWRVEPTYGPVWYPRGVASSWVPYSTGSWLNDPYYGWTWVDTAPWGWAPYHYGRWVYTSGFWGWCPGPRVARAYYAPALVAFYGSPVYSVGPVYSYGPSIGWVALGWGEPLYPWWGPTYFRSKPHWAGWGGHRRHWKHDHDDDDHHGGGHGHGGHGHKGHDRDWGDHGGKGGKHGHDGKDWGRGDDRDGRDRGDGRDWYRGGDRDGRDWNRDGRGGDDRNRGERGGELHAYQNARVKGAIVSTDREQFGRRSARASYRRASGDDLAPRRGDDATLPTAPRRTADARDGRRPSRQAERDVVTARREPSSELRRSADSRRERSAVRSFAPPASAESSSPVTRRGRALSPSRDERMRGRDLPNVSANPPGQTPVRTRRAEREARRERDQIGDLLRERQRPQPPQQAARPERDTRSRRESRGEARVERSREQPRVQRAPETRVERAPAPRMERSQERSAPRMQRPQVSSPRQESSRGDGVARSQGDGGQRSRGDGGGGRSRGDGGGRHGDSGGGRQGDGGGGRGARR